MKTDIQNRISDTISQITHLQAVERQLGATTEELDTSLYQLAQMDKQLVKELRDIEKLEGLSTKAIFHKILGNKEKQEEKERQEYLEISLKHEDLKKHIEILEYEINLLEGKIGNRVNLEKELSQLKSMREKEIISSDPSLRMSLMSISTEMEKLFRYKQELIEAEEVGKVCLNLAKQIFEQLKKVENWGQWGNNPQYRIRQRDAIDRARNLSYQIKHHLNLFDKELADIGKRLDMQYDLSKLTEFSDFFFNNIITDWIMRQQLSVSLQSAKRLYADLQGMVEPISQDTLKIQGQVEKLAQQREEILLG